MKMFNQKVYFELLQLEKNLFLKEIVKKQDFK